MRRGLGDTLTLKQTGGNGTLSLQLVNGAPAPSSSCTPLRGHLPEAAWRSSCPDSTRVCAAIGARLGVDVWRGEFVIAGVALLGGLLLLALFIV
jgi:hypothetical protein